MDKRAQELGEIKKEMEREDDALYAIKNKIRHLEDVEEDIHQARREMILYILLLSLLKLACIELMI
ncbi:hypothetical protein [Listeria innocua]|uniref:hypothetical protein n=1 Tax=Listeria innocua TaxID=1642 RepID=UPI0016252315|nr:hypothetical protein [Listeria innocua]MBC1377280.1 hypothetical protein [Listeria innocua]MBC1383909.1 hypothetical protein [Listeria innocua]